MWALDVERCAKLKLQKALRSALRGGWLGGDYLSTFCNYCGAHAEHEQKVRGYLCTHEPACLMVEYATLVGNVNDGEP